MSTLLLSTKIVKFNKLPKCEKQIMLIPNRTGYRDSYKVAIVNPSNLILFRPCGYLNYTMEHDDCEDTVTRHFRFDCKPSEFT